MPNEHVFSAININDLAMNIITGKNDGHFKMNMYEVADNYYRQIINFMELLETGKVVVYEHKSSKTVYRFQKQGRDKFFLNFNNGEVIEGFEITSNVVLNTIFKHAPFIDVIGTETNANNGGN